MSHSLCRMGVYHDQYIVQLFYFYVFYFEYIFMQSTMQIQYIDMKRPNGWRLFRGLSVSLVWRNLTFKKRNVGSGAHASLV